ncbi:PaaI family thioesterase [Flaviflexus huanghaiensis]|uniref:PaaI family thioesterase n=1 Tax=Flaviflexus huanghaiensis TaxID=1111473 RepID=UPI0015F7B361|nr:PaaI family thioesterase [Flaviflexus huanghaiensis]
MIDAVQAAIDSGPYNRWLGLTVMDLTKDSITLETEATREWTNATGDAVVHGGIVSALLDVASCFALVGSLGGTAPTIDLTTHFLRAVTPGKIIVTGRLVKPGRTVAIAEAELSNKGGKTAAIARGTFAASAVTPVVPR